ncbi:MAG TPA: hypothetical protein VG710_17740 [Opitutus sp.]|nr:hypothetical protein [Opitutus sp.]
MVRPQQFSLRSFGFGVAALVLLAAAVYLIGRKVDSVAVTQVIAGLDARLVIALMAILPLFGFPISVVYLVAGAKFGPVVGGVVIAGATAVHLAGSNWIGRGVLRGPIERLLARRKHHLPHVPAGANAATAALAVLVPGLPYFSRNYRLALTDVPLRVYFAVSLPLYVAHAYLTILLGDAGANPDRTTLLLLSGAYVLKLAISALLIWRIGRRFKVQAKAEDAGAIERREGRPSPETCR